MLVILLVILLTRNIEAYIQGQPCEPCECYYKEAPTGV